MQNQVLGVQSSKILKSLEKLNSDFILRVRILVNIVMINNDNQILTHRLRGINGKISLTIPVSLLETSSDIWDNCDKRVYIVANHARKTMMKMFGVMVHKVRTISNNTVLIMTQDDNSLSEYYNIGNTYVNKIFAPEYVPVEKIFDYASSEKLMVSSNLKDTLDLLENLDTNTKLKITIFPF